MKRRLITALTAVVCLYLCGVSRAAYLFLYPTNDAYVNNAEPDTIHNSNTLYAGYSDEITRSYLMFDLSSIPAGQSIVSAKLHLNPNYISLEAPVVGAYYLENDGWSESTLTWNNAPTNFNILPTSTETITTGDAFWLVTADAQLVYETDDIYSVVLKLPHEVATTPLKAGFWSSEAEISALSPYLSIQYQPVPEPATLLLLGLGGLILRKRRA